MTSKLVENGMIRWDRPENGHLESDDGAFWVQPYERKPYGKNSPAAYRLHYRNAQGELTYIECESHRQAREYAQMLRDDGEAAVHGNYRDNELRLKG